MYFFASMSNGRFFRRALQLCLSARSESNECRKGTPAKWASVNQWDAVVSKTNFPVLSAVTVLTAHALIASLKCILKDRLSCNRGWHGSEFSNLSRPTPTKINLFPSQSHEKTGGKSRPVPLPEEWLPLPCCIFSFLPKSVNYSKNIIQITACPPY